MLSLRNPHSVIAALETRPKAVEEVRLSRGSHPGEAWEKVVALAQAAKIPISIGADPGGSDQARRQPGRELNDQARRQPGRELNDQARRQPGREGGPEARVREKQSVPVEELFQGASQKAGGRGLWLAMDCLQDPHNVGAIFRSAAFFGVQGIVLTQERSAPLSSTVYDVSCGGLEHLPFTLQPNLQRAFEKAKEAGLWILGASESAKEDHRGIQADRPWLLVIGNEEKGMRRLTLEACDVVCGIAPTGKVGSLNASVAASILISRLVAGS